MEFEMQSNEEFSTFILKVNNRYLSWDEFRHKKIPGNKTVEELWCYVMFRRYAKGERLPIKANNGQFFILDLTKQHQKQISVIDSSCSGAVSSSVNLPKGKETNQLIISGLIEEAISSSQLEGASTLRDVAKRMIQSSRNPRDTSEQMILNNYVVMTKVEKWVERDLSEDFIKEIHRVITKDILPKDKCGEYRTDKDDITVGHTITGKIYHRPKKFREMKKDMNDLCHFANTDDKNDYIHPIIKAIVLHFWIGYLHPFIDGNGRTARVIFYWYIIKKGYWAFKYIPLSDVIKKSKRSYGNAFLNCEQEDELNLGYFVQYILRATVSSIDAFKQYLERKREKERKMRISLEKFGHFNERQIDIVNTLENNIPMDIATHKMKFALSYETARRDFLLLEEKNILVKKKSGKKFVYSLITL